jgi:hypothetical protein
LGGNSNASTLPAMAPPENGEQRIGKQITQTAQPQLIDRALLLEQIQHATDFVAVGGREVEPDDLSACHQLLNTRPEITFAFPTRTPFLRYLETDPFVGALTGSSDVASSESI